MAKELALGGPLAARVDGSIIALRGHVNEATSFKPLLAIPGPLTIDVSGVDRINSLGVRNWCNFVRDAEAAGTPLTFLKVSPVMVQQLGMITHFFGRTSYFKSFHAPYLCEKCNTEHLHVVELERRAPFQIPSSLPCPKCGNGMILDEVPEMYVSLSEKLAAGTA